MRSEACQLKSLTFFNANFMSLTSTHPIITTAGSSPAEVVKSLVQILMLSGRYRCGSLQRHWSKENTGFCILSSKCNEVEDIQHILQRCEALTPIRNRLINFNAKYSSNLPDNVSDLICDVLNPSHSRFCSFVLDCTSQPEVVSLVQLLGHDVIWHFLRVTRTWLYALHRERLKILGQWKRPQGL